MASHSNPYNSIRHPVPLLLRNTLCDPHDVPDFLLPHLHVSVKNGVMKLFMIGRIAQFHFFFIEELQNNG